jgi:hypothetical protein
MPDIYTHASNTVAWTLSGAGLLASFFFDQTLSVVTWAGIAAYWAAYGNAPDRWWKYVLMTLGGILLACATVSLINWGGAQIFDKWTNPPPQPVALIFGYVWIDRKTRRFVLAEVKLKFKSWFPTIGTKGGGYE